MRVMSIQVNNLALQKVDLNEIASSSSLKKGQVSNCLY